MEYGLAGGLLVLGMIVFIVQSIREDGKRKKRFVETLRQQFGTANVKKYAPGRLECLENRMREIYQEGEVDEITWTDLEFEQIFMLMDQTLTSSGEEYLYESLHLKKKSVSLKDEEIEFFRLDQDKRIEVQKKLANLGKTGNYSIHNYLELIKGVNTTNCWVHYLALVGVIAAIILCFFEFTIGFLSLICIAVINVLFYFSAKSKIDPYITTLTYLVKGVENGKQIADLDYSVLGEKNQQLNAIVSHLKGFLRFSSLLTKSGASMGNPIEVVLEYIIMILHLDLIKFYKMIQIIGVHEGKFVELTELIGCVDATISIGSFRTFLKHWCKPSICKELKIQAKDIYHPAIQEPVTNSFESKKSILITGSNASGKSTFLKTVAINSILANAIYTCAANEFCAPVFKIYTSMSLRDNLSQKESYFMVEIRAIKRILQAIQEADEEHPVLCVLDEVLRGTNTIERISASTEILQAFSTEHSICFAATHDIELTQTLESHYENYHFHEQIVENDILFDYLLKTGKATSKNAIHLLALMGYDQRIVDKATKRAVELENVKKNNMI